MGKLKGCLVFIGVPIVLLILLASCIGAITSKKTPDVVGKAIAVAQNDLKEAGFAADKIKVEAVDGKTANPNWLVCKQSIPPKEIVQTTSSIELLAAPKCPEVSDKGKTESPTKPAPPKVEAPPAVPEPAPVVPAPAPAPPAPVVAPPAPQAPTVTYASCTAVRAAGAAPIHRGDPGYSTKLDKDGDGVACE